MLIPQYIAVHAVVEHQGNHTDVVLRGRSQLLHAKHESTVPGHAKHGLVRVGHLHAQRRVKAKPQSALVTGGYISSGFINLKSKIGSKAHLAELFHKETVTRQHIPNQVQVAHLRLHFLDIGQQPGLHLFNAVAMARCRHIGGGQLFQQRRCRAGRIAQHIDISVNPAELLRVDVDANQFFAFDRREAPHHIAPAHKL